MNLWKVDNLKKMSQQKNYRNCSRICIFLCIANYWKYKGIFLLNQHIIIGKFVWWFNGICDYPLYVIEIHIISELLRMKQMLYQFTQQ